MVGLFDASYAPGLEVVAHRLVELRCAYPLYVMATANAHLAAANVVGSRLVIEVRAKSPRAPACPPFSETSLSPWPMPPPVVQVEPVVPPGLSFTGGRHARMYTKLRQWEAFASTHDLLVSLDADLLPLRNLDHLFDLPLPPSGLLAVPDQTVCFASPSKFNGGGPYVLRPSLDTFSALLAAAASPSLFTNGKKCGCDSDQEVLNEHFQPCRNVTAGWWAGSRACVRFLPLEYALYQEQCDCLHHERSPMQLSMSARVPLMDLERVYTLHMICRGYGETSTALNHCISMGFASTLRPRPLRRQAVPLPHTRSETNSHSRSRVSPALSQSQRDGHPSRRVGASQAARGAPS